MTSTVLDWSAKVLPYNGSGRDSTPKAMAEKNKKLDENKLAEMLTDKYARPWWKLFGPIFGFFVLLPLPSPLTTADIHLMAASTNSQKFLKHIFMDIALIVIDLTMLIPIIFEVDTAQAAPDKLILKTIFWKAAIPYDKIVALKTPSVWQFVLVRT